MWWPSCKYGCANDGEFLCYMALWFGTLPAIGRSPVRMSLSRLTRFWKLPAVFTAPAWFFVNVLFFHAFMDFQHCGTSYSEVSFGTSVCLCLPIRSLSTCVLCVQCSAACISLGGSACPLAHRSPSRCASARPPSAAPTVTSQHSTPAS